MGSEKILNLVFTQKLFSSAWAKPTSLLHKKITPETLLFAQTRLKPPLAADVFVAQKTAQSVEKTAKKVGETLYDGVDVSAENFELVVDNMKFMLKGPQRKKLRKMAVGEVANLGGGSSSDNELFNICGLKINQLSVTKKGEGSYKVVNKFPNTVKAIEVSDYDILSTVRFTNPDFYNLVKKQYDTGNIDKETLKVICDLVKSPIDDIAKQNAVFHYKNDGFKLINKYLREGKIEGSPEYITRIKREVKILEELIQSRSYGAGLKLYRGDNYPIFDSVIIKNGTYKDKPLSELLKQMETMPKDAQDAMLFDVLANNDIHFIQKSFLSTSLLKGAHKEHKPIQFVLETQGDVNGVCLETVAKSVHSNEIEFLLNKNSAIHLTGIEQKNGQWEITGLLSQGKKP